MTTHLITVVFRLDQEQLVQMQNHPKSIAFSMGDALKDLNYCQRCGKPTGDPGSIHTCTPPSWAQAEKRTDWSAS